MARILVPLLAVGSRSIGGGTAMWCRAPVTVPRLVLFDFRFAAGLFQLMDLGCQDRSYANGLMNLWLGVGALNEGVGDEPLAGEQGLLVLHRKLLVVGLP